jgi:hypothetical protein
MENIRFVSMPYAINDTLTIRKEIIASLNSQYSPHLVLTPSFQTVKVTVLLNTELESQKCFEINLQDSESSQLTSQFSLIETVAFLNSKTCLNFLFFSFFSRNTTIVLYFQITYLAYCLRNFCRMLA